jgi:hypothetical protein
MLVYIVLNPYYSVHNRYKANLSDSYRPIVSQIYCQPDHHTLKDYICCQSNLDYNCEAVALNFRYFSHRLTEFWTPEAYFLREVKSEEHNNKM